MRQDYTLLQSDDASLQYEPDRKKHILYESWIQTISDVMFNRCAERGKFSKRLDNLHVEFFNVKSKH